MLEVKTFEVNPIQENMYIVHDETKEAVIIDCGSFYPQEHQAIFRYIQEKGLTLKHLLCTHGHLDHCFGNIAIYQKYGLKPEVMAEDEYLITKLDEQASNMFGFKLEDEIPPVAPYLKAGDEISFGTHRLQVIATPGHTPGSAVFYCAEEGIAFTGDTLFYMSVGRTDFEGGSYRQLTESLERLKQLLPPATRLYTGHGPMTSMEAELKHNMYLR